MFGQLAHGYLKCNLTKLLYGEIMMEYEYAATDDYGAMDCDQKSFTLAVTPTPVRDRIQRPHVPNFTSVLG